MTISLGKYTLKPFQQQFVDKAVGVTNVLLADEMGLLPR
jgi:hypothetical protein